MNYLKNVVCIFCNSRFERIERFNSDDHQKSWICPECDEYNFENTKERENG